MQVLKRKNKTKQMLRMTVAFRDPLAWTSDTTILLASLYQQSGIQQIVRRVVASVHKQFAAGIYVAYRELQDRLLVLFVTGQAGVSPVTFAGSTAKSGQPAIAPGLQGTAAGRPGRAGRGGPHPRIGRGQPHMTADLNQSPAPLSTGVQKQQPAVAAASHDRHKQHHRQQQRSLNVAEPDSAVQLALEREWVPPQQQQQQQQQQVQLLQRNAGSRHGGADTAPQAPSAAKPMQAGAGQRSPNLVALYGCCKCFLR